MTKAEPASVSPSRSAKAINSFAKPRDFTRSGSSENPSRKSWPDFGALQHAMADEQQFRWLGPHKGVVQLALASVTNACWDLWAKTRGVPLWKLLLDLTPEQIVATLDLSYLEDELTAPQALKILREHQPTRNSRESILKAGYPGYDTSVGWFNYDDEQVRENCKRAIAAGFTAMKLKVGSRDPERDLRRAQIVREVAGDKARVMVDANQQWTLPQALDICQRLRAINPFWIEEPTHPDDVLGHKTLADAIAPTKLALGEHVPEPRRFQKLFAGEMRRIHPSGRRARGGRERISRRQFAVPQIRRARRAARRRHGATASASRFVQPHRARSRSHFSRTHSASARTLRPSVQSRRRRLSNSAGSRRELRFETGLNHERARPSLIRTFIWWNPAQFRYPWLDGLPALNRAFLPADFAAASANSNVGKIIFVECGCEPAQSLAEVDWVSGLAKDEPRLKGIVAHADAGKRRSRPRRTWKRWRPTPLVKGVRRNLQGERDAAFCLRPEFVAGVKLLAEFGFHV